MTGHYQNPKRGFDLLQSLKSLRDEKISCDFEIRVEKRTFSVHRHVLMASSEYFRAMFQSGMKESAQEFVELEGLSASGVEKCLDYLYSGEIELEFASIDEVLDASSHLQLDDVLRFCSEFLRSHLTEADCLVIWHYGKKYSKDEVIEQTENFIKRRFKAVTATHEFLQLGKSVVTHFLQMDHGNGMPELWKAVRVWINFAKEDRKHHLLDFLREITALNTDVPLIINLIISEDLVKSNEDALKYLVTEILFKDIETTSREITVKNCFILKEAFEKFQSFSKYSDVKVLVIRFLEMHFTTISQSHEFLKLSWEDVNLLFESQQVKGIEEKVKFESIVTWVRENEKIRRKHFPDLFRRLTLKRASADYIQNIIRKEPLVQDSISCREMVADAFYDHLLSEKQGMKETVESMQEKYQDLLTKYERELIK